MLCTKCDTDKPDDEFSWKNKAEGRRQKICRSCQRKVRRAWYVRNRDHAISYATKSNNKLKDRNAKYLFDYLKSHPCVECGEDDPLVLEFDHVRGKKIKDVAQLAHEHASIKRIQEEIDKCDIRCANCHRRKTYRQLGWRRVVLNDMPE